MKISMRHLAIAALSAAVLTACHDSITQPNERAAADLHFLRPAPGAPALLDTVVSFWAHTDADADTGLRYAPVAGSTETQEFLHFTVPAGALMTRPDGTPFAAHDSVLITIRMADFSRQIVDFQPSGLRFSPEHLPLLKMFFQNDDHDFNGDGVENAADTTVESELAMWKQELPGQPWYRLGDTLHVESDEAEASIPGFTGYALAY